MDACPIAFTDTVETGIVLCCCFFFSDFRVGGLGCGAFLSMTIFLLIWHMYVCVCMYVCMYYICIFAFMYLCAHIQTIARMRASTHTGMHWGESIPCWPQLTRENVWMIYRVAGIRGVVYVQIWLWVTLFHHVASAFFLLMFSFRTNHVYDILHSLQFVEITNAIGKWVKLSRSSNSHTCGRKIWSFTNLW